MFIETNRVVRQTPPSRSDSGSVERGTGNHHMAPPSRRRFGTFEQLIVLGFAPRVGGLGLPLGQLSLFVWCRTVYSETPSSFVQKLSWENSRSSEYHLSRSLK